MKVPFWNSSNRNENEKSPKPLNPSNQGPADIGMDYTSGMVDVLDTIGMMVHSSLVTTC